MRFFKTLIKCMKEIVVKWWIVSGEVTLTLTIHLLARGNTMDLGIIFDLESCYSRKMMYEVLLEWVITTDFDCMHMVCYLGDNEGTIRASAGNSKRFNVVLIEATGSLDGCLVPVIRYG